MSFVTYSSNPGLVPSGLAANYALRKRNLLRYSQQFEDAAWIKGATTVTSNAAVGPDGSPTADRLEAGGVNSYVLQSLPCKPRTTYTFSIWLRADSSTAIGYYIDDTREAVNGPILVDTFWQRFSFAFTTTTGAQITCYLGGAARFTAGQVVYAWGAQLNEGSSPLSYEQTTDNQVLIDSSGRANHGSLGSSPAPDANDPLWTSSGLRFTPGNYCVTVPQSAPQFTEMLVFMLDAMPVDGNIGGVLVEHYGEAQGFFVSVYSDGRLLFRAHNGSTSFTLFGNTVLTLGKWYCAAARLSKTELSLFLSASLDGSLPFTGYQPNPGPNSHIGGWTTVFPFSGSIAYRLSYSRALADGEIRRNWHYLQNQLRPRGIILP